MKAATTTRPQVSTGYPYTTIGTAIDYRLRYYFASTPHRDLVAYDGAELLAEMYPQYSDPTQALFDDLAQFESDPPAQRRLVESEEYQLNRHCYVLALLEQLSRSLRSWGSSPLLACDTVNEWLNIQSEEEIQDLAALSWLFYDSHSNLLSLPCNLNPIFVGSDDVDGADADLIVDSTSVDIKTTIKASVAKDYIYQLIGYVLLDYTNEYQIDRIGLYMTRQGILL
ncbi:MAG: hypothetical protein OXL97_14295 [Chloroflexota bacterium]|nr:hypothetical protein [Chloroflexota bacterium]MDE2885942.1 hypothetical protein [Chloroflexota bacterium]